MPEDARHRTKVYLEQYLDNANLTDDTTGTASGTADSGTTTTTVDAERTEANDYWNGYYIKFTSGSNFGRERLITDFDAATDTITHNAFPNAVAVDDTYVLTSVSTAVSFIVAYADADYPLIRVFIDKDVDLVFCIGTPDSEALPVGVGYIENIPITVWCIDKTGLTGTKLRWKAEAELRRVAETYPSGSLRTLNRLSDNKQNLGSTILYSVNYIMRYTRFS